MNKKLLGLSAYIDNFFIEDGRALKNCVLKIKWLICVFIFHVFIFHVLYFDIYFGNQFFCSFFSDCENNN